jgi:hypothetical protein
MAKRDAQGSSGKKEEFWKSRIQECQDSGTPVGEFCKAKGIARATFYWWSRKLRERGKTKKTNETPTEAVIATSAVNPRFLPVHVIASIKPSEGNRNPLFSANDAIEIHVAGLRKILVRPGFDAQTLGRVVSVLEDIPC